MAPNLEQNKELSFFSVLLVRALELEAIVYNVVLLGLKLSFR